MEGRDCGIINPLGLRSHFSSIFITGSPSSINLSWSMCFLSPSDPRDRLSLSLMDQLQNEDNRVITVSSETSLLLQKQQVSKLY